MERVLIASPVREHKGIFLEYLDSIRKLDKTGLQVDVHFIFNNCDYSDLLDTETCESYSSEDETYRVQEDEHKWERSNVAHMVEMRNRCIKRCLAGGYDYLFFVDSDLILPGQTLQQLVADDKDIVAALFWTIGKDGRPWNNAWEYDQCSTDIEMMRLLATVPGVHRVGGTGACMLVKRCVFERGVDYSPLFCIRGLIGEDRNFCIRAEANGFELYADNRIQPLHLYRLSEYEKYMEKKRGGRVC